MNKFEFIFDTDGNISEINYYESFDSSVVAVFKFNEHNINKFYDIISKNCDKKEITDLGGYFEHDFYGIDDSIVKEMLLTEDNLEENGEFLYIVEDDDELSRKYAELTSKNKSIIPIPDLTREDDNLEVISFSRPIVSHNKSYDNGIYDQYFENDSFFHNNKINRSKRGKKILIKVGAALLASLIVFGVSKSHKKNDKNDIDSTPNNNIEYTITPSATQTPIVTSTPIPEINNSSEDEINPVEEIIEIPSEIKEEESIVETKTDNTENVDEKTNILNLNTDNLLNDLKYINAKENYFETITKYANTYGIDPKLALAICTHEKGTHSSSIDYGGGMGLFQIQLRGGFVWDSVRAFNFDTNSWETVSITEESVADLDENIKAGCMIIQNALIEQNYDVPKAVQSYNYGTKNLQHVLNSYVYTEGLDYSVLDNPYNVDWLKYRYVISGGDPKYLENVFKYIEDGATLEFKKPNGEIVSFIYDNVNCDDYVQHM